MNLTVNARDAMPQGGKVTVEVRNVELDDGYVHEHFDVKPGPYVCLSVSDTGCGMDRTTAARIFEPFYTTKSPGRGTGLGLATVYGIVKQSGGDITVYSEPGCGTAFKIYLPRDVDVAAQAERLATALPPLTGEETVLLVEDEGMVRQFVRTALQGYGYTVLEAEGGAEALHLCETHQRPIHLVVTDVVMPGMSGREMAEQAVRIRPGVKVLFMSGYTDDAVVRHGVLHAEAQFIQKPFTPSALGRKVRDVLQSA
jgi:two-component system cell cycle sensor histidine kinase/response regulator CckA